jgi:hypothetical protein
MTELLAKAFAEAGKLPAPDQDALARWLLAEMQSEKIWQEKFASSGDLLKQLAEEAIEEHRRGETQELDPDRL